MSCCNIDMFRNEAKFRIVEVGNAPTGRHVGVADAGL